MEFYQISCGANGWYELIEVDKNLEPAHLSNAQVGRLADRLSALYWQQDTLPLKIRIYLTAYYSQGDTEYISVKSTPSLLLGDTRLQLLYGREVCLDGFALTFLEGEEENRVWIGEDGAVENRGQSTEKVRQLLDILVGSLNEPPAELICLSSRNCTTEWSRRLRILQTWSEKNDIEPLLDLNQEAIIWCQALQGQQWQDVLLTSLEEQTPLAEARLPLLAAGAHYELYLSGAQMALRQYCYAWEAPRSAEKLWLKLLDLLGPEGEQTDEKSIDHSWF